MQKLLLALLLCCLVNEARANDSAVQGVGGSLQPLKGEHPQVRMVRETVRLDIYHSYYDVTARFIFKNEGAADTTGMGFPEGAYGDVSDEGVTNFKNFRSTIDGRAVKTVRQVLKSEEGSEEYNALWVKKVPFGRGQSRTVEVRYRAPMGSSVGMGINKFAAYEFTGGNWRGKVDRSDLICTFHEPATTLLSTWFGDNELAMRRSGNTWTYTWRNWEAQGSFVFRLTNTVPGWLLLNREFGPLPNWEKGKYYFIESANAPAATSIPEGKIDFYPPAYLEKGVTYIGMGDLRYWLSNQSSEARRKDKVEVAWRKDGLTTLQLNGRSISVKAGSTQLFDSYLQSPIEMPVKPQLVGGRLYVPLAPVLRALHGSVKFGAPKNGRVRDIKLSIPPFWEQAAG